MLVGCGNELLVNGSEERVNAIMKVVEKARKKNVRVPVTSLLRRPACNEYERLREEVNIDLHEKILVMKAESVRKREVSSRFLDMDSLIQAGCFSEMESTFRKKGRQSSLRFIRWIKATHLMEGRID
ncbi:hypothetical protein FHG87_023790 [Trinorchestia longiramus]|nr:hypothetical protein FHG87_023790 [Trinorchestia longiramus]